MNNINTSSVLIRNLGNLCAGVIEMLSSSQKDLTNQYQSAGNDWSDSKYQLLGDIINECNSSLNKAIRDLKGCLTQLGDLAQYLQEYEDVNFFGDTSTANGNFSSSAGNHTPINNGQWSGERGNSVWQPNNVAVINDIRLYSNGKTEGIKYQNGYADFTDVQVFESRMSSQLFYRNDAYQFVDCTLELRALLEEHARLDSPNRDLLQWFDEEQLDAIGRGSAEIPGYTWHHDVQAGRMQLIPTSIHSTCPHEGGRSIWGGGISNR